MRPGDLLVCAFIKHPLPGEIFTEWPLHVTIVPWFRTDESSEELSQNLKDSYKSIKPFQVLMGSETTMGRGKLVNLVQEPTLLMDIEQATRDHLKNQQAWLVDETTKRRHEYRPHVTAQAEDRLYTGDTFVCDALWIVEQQGNTKQVAAKIEL